jgi:hypothetical protein
LKVSKLNIDIEKLNMNRASENCGTPSSNLSYLKSDFLIERIPSKKKKNNYNKVCHNQIVLKDNIKNIWKGINTYI